MLLPLLLLTRHCDRAQARARSFYKYKIIDHDQITTHALACLRGIFPLVFFWLSVPLHPGVWLPVPLYSDARKKTRCKSSPAPKKENLRGQVCTPRVAAGLGLQINTDKQKMNRGCQDNDRKSWIVNEGERRRMTLSTAVHPTFHVRWLNMMGK